jgi:hypothetical protein
MSKIELRLSDVDPPVAEPKRTIYRDIVNLPDPVKLGITIRYFNHDDVDLYFQITGSGTGYTFGTVNLGLLASGANAYTNLDEFASRTKPSASDLPNGEKEENITLILKAYTDSGYTNLKWTYERIVTVHWINSADAAFTVDVLNNFDDGTVQGWAVANEQNNRAGYPTIAVATDYVLSAPYSCKITQFSLDGTYLVRSRLYKSFATPNKATIYAIMDIRNGLNVTSTYGVLVYNKINRDTTPLILLGQPEEAFIPSIDYFVRNKWIRIVIPLPANTTVEIRIIQQIGNRRPAPVDVYSYLWLDDFRIISK